MSDRPQDGQEIDAPWHRLSFLAMFFVLIVSALGFIRQQLFSAGPLILMAALFSGNSQRFALFALAGLGAFFLVRTLTYFATFRFQMGQDQIRVRQGLFSRELITLHYDRIQNVNISTPFYFQPFDLVNCRIDSAGSQAAEIELPGIKREVAEDLNRRVLAHHPGGMPLPTPEGEAAAPQFVDGDLVLTLSPAETAKAGLINARVMVVTSFLFVFAERVADGFGFELDDFLEDTFLHLPHFGALGDLLVYGGTFAALAVVIMVGSAIASMVQLYRYELYDGGSRLIRRVGLTERHQTSLRKPKIQGVSVHQNIRGFFFGRVAVVFHQIESGGNSGDAGDTFLLPVVPRHDWRRLAMLALPELDLSDKIKFRRVGWRYLWRLSLFFVILPLGLLQGLAYFRGDGVYPQAMAGLAGFGLVLCCLRYWRLGYSEIGEFLIVRTGFLGWRYTLFPVFKVQQVFESQTIFQRRHSVKDIGFALAFRTVRLPWMRQDKGHALLNRVLATVETSRRPWF